MEQLRRWRVNEGLTVAQVAARAGRLAATVAEQLRKAGVLTAPRRWQPPALDVGLVRRLYVDERRTLMQIARQLCCSDTRVRAALLAAGVELRPSRQRRDRPVLPQLSEVELRELYLERGLTAAQIAASFGGSSTRVLAALARHGIPRRPGGSRPVPTLDVDAAALTDLYVHRRLDDAEIAARLQVPTWRVLARRRELGVYRPFVPPPHPGPPPAPPAELLQRLYLEEQLPIAVIAKRYRTATPVARRWLHEAGIPIRPRTARAHRRQWDLALLRELYEGREWSSAEIAAHLDTTDHQVLRALHDAGIPVRRRRGGGRRRGPAPLQLLDTLYADPEVSAILRRFRVPRRPNPGSIADRFPAPVRLTVGLLRALYLDVGLSARQIELLTGEPFEQILDALHAAAIPVRREVGWSPWLVRQRT